MKEKGKRWMGRGAPLVKTPHKKGGEDGEERGSGSKGGKEPRLEWGLQETLRGREGGRQRETERDKERVRQKRRKTEKEEDRERARQKTQREDRERQRVPEPRRGEARAEES